MATTLHPPVGARRPGPHAEAFTRRLAFWFAVGVLSLAFANFVPLAREEDLYSSFGSGGPTNPLYVLLSYFRYGVYLICLTGLGIYAIQRDRLAGDRSRLLYVIRRNVWVLLWLACLILSFSRSPALQSNVISGIIPILNILSVGFLCVYLGRAALIVRALYYALVLCLAASFFAVWQMPDLAIHSATGPSGVALAENLAGLWKGIFGHKNVAGGCFMELFTLSITLLFTTRENKVMLGATAVGSAVFLFFAGSNSSYVAPMIACAMLVAVRLLRVAYRIIPDTFLVFYVAFPFVVVAYLANYGVTLDGRDAVWRAAIAYTEGSWLFGHGFANGFGTAGMARYADGRWLKEIGHAHSGVMDSYVYFGLIGIAILWLMIRTVLRDYLLLIHDKGAIEDRGYVLGGFMVFTCAVARSMTEPDVLNVRGGWMIMLLCALIPSVQLWRYRARSEVRRRAALHAFQVKEIA